MTNEQALDLSENETVFIFYNNTIKTCVVCRVKVYSRGNLEVSITDNGTGIIYKLKPQQIFHTRQDCHGFYQNHFTRHKSDLQKEVDMKTHVISEMAVSLNALSQMPEAMTGLFE